jgi:UDP-3-O-acyl-N-acetylglucosamine deacetylase
LNESLHLTGDGCRFTLEPADELRVHYLFEHPELGSQDYACAVNREDAVLDILPARTFATNNELAQAQSAGLLTNTDENAALLVSDGVPNSQLRFENEFARHKVLDLMGDLYLLDFDWKCNLTAYRTGHAMNHRLAKLLLKTARSSQLR